MSHAREEYLFQYVKSSLPVGELVPLRLLTKRNCTM